MTFFHTVTIIYLLVFIVFCVLALLTEPESEEELDFLKDNAGGVSDIEEEAIVSDIGVDLEVADDITKTKPLPPASSKEINPLPTCVNNDSSKSNSENEWSDSSNESKVAKQKRVSKKRKLKSDSDSRASSRASAHSLSPKRPKADKGKEEEEGEEKPRTPK